MFSEWPVLATFSKAQFPGREQQVMRHFHRSLMIRERQKLAESVSTDRWARTVIYAAKSPYRQRQGTESFGPYPAIRGEYLSDLVG